MGSTARLGWMSRRTVTTARWLVLLVVGFGVLHGSHAAGVSDLDMQTDAGIFVVENGDVLNAWSTGVDRVYDADTTIAWFFWRSESQLEVQSEIVSDAPTVVPTPVVVVPNFTLPIEYTQFAVLHTCAKSGSSLITWTLTPKDPSLDAMEILWVKECTSPVKSLQVRAPDGTFLVRNGVANLEEKFKTHNESLALSVYTTSPAVSLVYFFLDLFTYDPVAITSLNSHFVAKDAVASVKSQEPPVYIEHECEDTLENDTMTLVVVQLNFTAAAELDTSLQNSLHPIAVYYTVECEARFNPFGSILTAALLISVPIVLLLGAFAWSKRKRARRILEWTFKLQNVDEQDEQL